MSISRSYGLMIKASLDLTNEEFSTLYELLPEKAVSTDHKVRVPTLMLKKLLTDHSKILNQVTLKDEK